MSEHTAKAYDAELQDLARMVAEMGGLAEKQIADAVDALVERDAALAQRVDRARSRPIDALQREIEEKAILTIARRQPMAVDLREIVGAHAHLQRSRAHRRPRQEHRQARDRARRRDLSAAELIRGVEHMAELVLGQLKQVLDAYAQRDVGKAIAVWTRRRARSTRMYNSLFRELLTYMMEDPRNITFCTHLLFCAKNIERIGDHATNIAETVYYMVEGRALAEERPKGDTTSIAPVPYAGVNLEQRSRRDDDRPHPDRRGRGAADAAAALQSRSRRLRGRDRRRAATRPRSS